MPASGRSYAVVWRGHDGVAQPGRVTLGASAIRFEGGRGRLSALTLPYTDVAGVRMSSYAERVGGRPTLVVERRAPGRSVRIAAVGGPGALAEIHDRLTQLAGGRRT